ncbi:hypothetical protein OTK49_02325 [Vibrio coralliirubri]|uniref:hypothetical protein n=1 Tax=Vibrio coralliirubri TaxID=1516159 RepID=UPI0022843146|nr:hypothetical protein [Vibrio coralliirubri]MCY9861352.1 hypothetical protein [Vibrio coralliirubri]
MTNPNDKKTEENLEQTEANILEQFRLRQEAQIAAQKLYRNELPVQPLMITYEPYKQGDWELVSNPKPVPSSSYFGTIISAPDYRLQKTRGTGIGVWMSITPMELQSATIHLTTLIDVAQSSWDNDGKVPHIVIGGFGMGMFLLNALFQLENYSLPAKITVVELSKDIPEIVMAASSDVTEQLLADALSGDYDVSLEIIHDDLLKMQPINDVDYMFVDIWQMLGTDAAREQSRELKKNWNPKAYGYWGEEIDVAVYGKELVDELNLSDYYNDPRIMDACDVIFEAKVGLPIKLARKKLSAIGSHVEEDQIIMVSIKDESRNVDFFVPKYEDDTAFASWYLNKSKSRIFVVYGDQFNDSFEVEYRFNEEAQTWSSSW